MSTPTEPLPDLSELRLPVSSARICEAQGRRRTLRPERGERFLKGPIPWGWIGRAARLPGQSLHVGLALWFQAGLEKTDRVTLSLGGLEATLGVKRDAARRGLAALEEAHLVSVERYPGRKPVVTILNRSV